MGERGGTGGIARVEENGEKEFSASRKNAHCVHARGQLPLLPPCPIPIFSVPKGRERRERKREREREEARWGRERRDGGQNSEFSRTFRCERITESVARSRFPMKGFFSGILYNRLRFTYS